ncbi:lysosomal alpha-glucosidase-like [Lycorma delicatula]|uniref:lysosomal alpha-glucosidase-like n=1 Tax=Lycorma delicatula TaxID=130591 RepID=UPI003F51159F
MKNIRCNSFLRGVCFASFFVNVIYFFIFVFVVFPPKNEIPNFEKSSGMYPVKNDRLISEKEFTVGLPPVPEFTQCEKVNDDEKFDCFPRGIVTQNLCENRGCCWSAVSNKVGSVPPCYYPRNYTLYKYENITSTDAGTVGYMKNVHLSPYPEDIQCLRIDINYETDSRVHVKIYDPIQTRFEPPFPYVPKVKGYSRNPLYEVKTDKNKIGFTVVRKSSKKAIFDSLGVGGFTFANQFLQLSAKLSTKFIYGLGQHRNDFLLSTDWYTRTLFNRDQTPAEDMNLYGSHPFFLGVEEGGDSFGVFLLNSNAMDVILQPSPAVTYRTIGGILNFYIFLGPTPEEVIQQYTEVVGKPMLPPYWSLGFHLCRWGYNSLENTKTIMEKNLAAGIPLDVQWNDIDYMEDRKDLLYDKKNFAGLSKFVDDLHEQGMHYVVIIDPGISNVEAPGTYFPYDDAVAMDVLVKNNTGDILLGKVWNTETTAFLDFFNPDIVDYWKNSILRQQKEQFKYDGLWIDMNEPSDAPNGSIYGCPDDVLEHPPYVPSVSGGQLSVNTICMTAKHTSGNHYNLHNLYSLAEGIVTNYAISQVTGKRPFIISRATFSGQGKYTGTWGGDNISTWKEMARSIPYILNSNLFGMPLSGEDICGFQKETTVALCQRWMQLGAFYPFSRNHNSINEKPQDPVSLGPDVVNSSLKALTIRYTLLPYLYTLFWLAHINGDTVARPLFFEFPSDVKTYDVSTQFLWGPALHIIPVLTEGATKVDAYIPKGRWFDYYTGNEIISKGERIRLPAPLDTIPLLLRGGYVISTQEPALNTVISRNKNMGLLIIPNEKNEAKGFLFWDDGDLIDPYEKNEYNFLEFYLTENKVINKVVKCNYIEQTNLGNVDIFGVKTTVNSVMINNVNWKNFKYLPDSKKLIIEDLNIDMCQTFVIQWT